MSNGSMRTSISRVHFSEVFHKEKNGFDIVIANPPYIQLQSDGSRLATRYAECGYETFVGNGDIYTLFYERGNNILNDARAAGLYYLQ